MYEKLHVPIPYTLYLLERDLFHSFFQLTKKSGNGNLLDTVLNNVYVIVIMPSLCLTLTNKLTKKDETTHSQVSLSLSFAQSFQFATIIKFKQFSA